MKRFNVCLLLVLLVVACANFKCGGGGGGGETQTTGLVVKTEETLFGPAGETVFTHSVSYSGQLVNRLSGATGSLTNISGTTSSLGLDPQPDAVTPADWEFTENSGDCAGQSTFVPGIPQAGTATLNCVVIEGLDTITPATWYAATASSTEFIITGPPQGTSLKKTASVVVVDIYGRYFGDASLLLINGNQVTVNCPAVTGMASGTYAFECLNAKGVIIGTAYLQVVGSSGPPPPPTDAGMTSGDSNGAN